jgi:hypothetical protein
MSEKLDELLLSVKEGKTPEATLSAEMFEQRTLAEVIKDFEEMSIVGPLWAEGRIPDHLNNYQALAKWIDVFEFVQERRIGGIIHERIADIRQKLEDHVAKISTWTKDYKIIISSSTEKSGKYQNKINDPMRDLGLVRWNYELKQNEKEDVIKYVEALTGGDESDMTDAAQQIATKMEFARSDPRHCLVVCAILWALSCFESIDKLVEECKATDFKKIPATLLVLQLAARLKSGVGFSTEKRRFIVGEALRLLGLTKKSNRKGLLLGAGFVLYHAWKQEMIDRHTKDRLLGNQPEIIRKWAEQSFEIGEEACQSIETNSLPWAYAVNHCAYVSIVTGVYPEKTDEYVEILFRLKTLPAIWSPRFDDTLGCYYLIRAEKEWFLSIDKKKVDINDEIKNAKMFLEEATKKDPGDIDILEHLGRLHRISNEYNDFMNNINFK